MTQNFKNLKVYEDAFRLSKDLYIFFQDKKVSFRTKEQLLAIGDRNETRIAADRYADAPYR